MLVQVLRGLRYSLMPFGQLHDRLAAGRAGE